MTTEIITPNNELRKLVEDGYFFNFCIAFALNKGFHSAIKEKKEVLFAVGDYDVLFNPEEMCFILTNRVYFARIITAYIYQVVFIGDNEDEVINELLTELEKEFQKELAENFGTD